jgi:predicted NUDIX family NTP pyrophosphohydrolase
MSKVSAGLLLWRRNESGVEVLLGHPGGPYFAKRDDGSWSVPKGEYEWGEEPIAAAYREFTEELGIAPPPGDPVPLGYAQSGPKVNYVWALEGDLDAAAARSNTFTMEWPPRSGREQEFPELDRADWFDLETARRKIFAGQLPFLDRLADYLES